MTAGGDGGERGRERGGGRRPRAAASGEGKTRTNLDNAQDLKVVVAGGTTRSRARAACGGEHRLGLGGLNELDVVVAIAFLKGLIKERGKGRLGLAGLRLDLFGLALDLDLDLALPRGRGG